MQPVNPVLPAVGFAVESLLAPRQAIVAFFSRVSLPAPAVETVSLDEAFGRVLARDIAADDDYPNVARSAMDGFALVAAATPGRFRIAGDVAMGSPSATRVDTSSAMRIPTGGALPPGADAVVPIEEAREDGGNLYVDERVEPGSSVIPCGADMLRGDPVITAGRRIRAAECGVLATLGMLQVPVYRRPVLAVLSSGDELIEPNRHPGPGQVRDSNRYAIAASLHAMGAQPRHYPTLRDEPGEFEAGLRRALDECDGVVVSGGSSVGERDRLPEAVAAVAKPGPIVHGLRLKPGKPTLLGADGGKPILGLPGNPASALMVLEAVAAPIVAALVGAPVAPATVQARLAAPISGRRGWTWYVPVALEHEGGVPLAHPLAVRSFSVSLAARADGYVVMDEAIETWDAGSVVTVHRFLGD